MTQRFIFIALCLATASAAVGQSIPSASVEIPGRRTIVRPEGRKILAAIPTIDAESESETDCSHLVHDVYEKAGFPYDYVTSRELYAGSTNFTRVRVPQAGDLVVWRGHVGIVIDPKQRSFFSFVRSGPDTQFYDSPYWRSRGSARFYRYLTERNLHSGPTLEAARRADQRAIRDDRAGSESQSPLPPHSTSSASNRDTREASGEIVMKVAAKSPSPGEITAAFVEMNQNFAASLGTGSVSSLGQTVIVYRELLVLAVQIKGKRGTALVRIESLGAPTDAETDSRPDWKERPLVFEKTKRGWVMRPNEDVAYIKREVALQVLSARLAELAQNTDPTPAQKADQKEVIRLLNWLVADRSPRVSAQSN